MTGSTNIGEKIVRILLADFYAARCGRVGLAASMGGERGCARSRGSFSFLDTGDWSRGETQGHT